MCTESGGMVNNYLQIILSFYLAMHLVGCERRQEHRTNDGENTVRTTARTPYERRANYGANYERELSRELRDAPVWIEERRR